MPPAKENILEKYDQKLLFQRYIGIFPEENKKYFSIFRTDQRPGCRFEWHQGVLYFIENTRYNGKLAWDIFDCISYLQKISYEEAIEKVVSENSEGKQENITYAKKKKTIIRFTTKPFQNNLFKLDNSILNEEGVFLVEDYWLGEGHDLKKNCVHNPRKITTIAYYFPDSGHTKLYFPYVDDLKWISNCNIDDLFGKYKLKYYSENFDYIIITKSQKDRLIISYHYKIEPCIAVQNEGSNISKEMKNFLLENFKHIYILFDNDEAGIRASQKLSRDLNATIIENNHEFKDAYEFFDNNNEYLKNVINEKIRTA